MLAFADLIEPGIAFMFPNRFFSRANATEQQVIHQMCKSHSPVLALRSTLASCLEEVTSTVRGRVVYFSREALHELDIQEGLLSVLSVEGNPSSHKGELVASGMMFPLYLFFFLMPLSPTQSRSPLGQHLGVFRTKKIVSHFIALFG